MVLSGCGSTAKNNNEKQTNAEQSSQNSSLAEQENTKSQEPLLEYSIFVDSVTPQPYFEQADPNDVVTPYIEEKFNIRAGTVYYNQGMSWKERLTQLYAAGSLPDVVVAYGANVAEVVKTGQYAPLTQLIKENMPNYMKWVPEEQWKIAIYDGEIYGVAKPFMASFNEEIRNDVYQPLQFVFSLHVREDILEMAGYKFKPIKELEKECREENRRPTVEDLKIEPAIDTAEAFKEFLQKVKALGIKVGDRDLIPFTIPWWHQAHLNYMLGFGYSFTWHWNDELNIPDSALGYDPKGSGYMFYKFMNQLFREGLLDKEFLVQKDDQLQEKWASGLVACGTWTPDYKAAEESLLKINPKAAIRPLNLMKPVSGKVTGIDKVDAMYTQFLVKKDFPDIPRLLRYWDWFYSDEGQDIITWGPESAGFWEIKDGKKVLKDPDMYVAFVTGEPAEKHPQYFGLDGNSRAYHLAPHFEDYKPKDIARSYPVRIKDFLGECDSVLNIEQNDIYNVSYKAQDDLENVDAYCWSNIFQSSAAKLVAAKTDEEFEKLYQIEHQKFIKGSNFEEAMKVVQEKMAKLGLIK